jgi:HD-GYP domain-containing protein (c-di-GMP phosphodiesterase class II)
MRRDSRFGVVLLATLILVSALGAQTGKDAIAQALAAYEADSFEKAYAIIVSGVPETGSDAKLKSSAADALARISIAEYEAKNYKNAYEGFRKALKYDPTNANATQYFLKIRKERDVSKLANEGVPRAAAPTVATQPATSPPQAAAPSSQAGVTAAQSPAAIPAAATTTSQAPAESSADVLSQRAQLIAMEEELKKAGSRMSSMESTVATTSSENQALKGQIDQQIKLIQNLIDAQQKNAASAAPASRQSSQEQAIMAQTMQILAKLAEQEKSQPPIVVQSSDEIKLLARSLVSQQDQLSSGNTLTTGLLVALIALFGLIALSIVFAVFLSARARRRQALQPAYATVFSPELIAGKQEGEAEIAAIEAPRPDSRTPLLEFISRDDQKGGAGSEALIKRDLIKAERLKRMYDEVRTGSLSWDTIRSYIAELDVALRADILKIVEQKLDEGDLLSNEAILPVIFPFLTDYDDFIREKSLSLARRALVEGKRPGEDAADGTSDADPFGLKQLLIVPEELHRLFKGQDQSLVTAKLSRGIGKELGLSNADCNLLYRAALAHDCGYLVLDRDRLQATIAKPEITEDDFEFIKSHTVKGISFFEGGQPPKAIQEAILYHHERNDGSGYPDGLKKDAIPQFAKIIGVAETFAALVSKRAYRERRDIQNALAIISDGTRTKFDADIVQALTKTAMVAGFK